MMKLRDLARKIRSKNAGPFWLTIDIFCETADHYHTICQSLNNTDIAKLFATDPAVIRRFDIDDLQVIKISLPRPQIQGTAGDSDMHGASFAVLLEEMVIH